VFDCPTQPSRLKEWIFIGINLGVALWARRKITLVDGLLYLLATSETCSAIWTCLFPTTLWSVFINNKFWTITFQEGFNSRKKSNSEQHQLQFCQFVIGGRNSNSEKHRRKQSILRFRR
jgi:hypothetical protein